MMPPGEPVRDLRDRSGVWMACAMLAVAALAGAAGIVSFDAQFRMIAAVKHTAVIAGLEALIPDTSAVVFACLAIALALHGKRAIGTRLLNLAAVAVSVCMNALAASGGWKSLAIWIMPPIAYAVASDRLISGLRSRAIERRRELGTALADEAATPLAIARGAALWAMRLTVAPPSTVRGFRRWVIDECPVAPPRRGALGGRTRSRTAPAPAAPSAPAAPEPHPLPAAAPRTRRPALPPADAPDVRSQEALNAAAEERYSGDLAAGALPSVRRIKREMHCSQDRAELARAHLESVAAGRPGRPVLSLAGRPQ